MTMQVLTDIPQKLERAFELRLAHFGKGIKFYNPGLKSYATDEMCQANPRQFVSVSLTGKGCALNCDHCEKKILEPMLALDKREGLFEMCRRLKEGGTEGILLSGGSLKTGEVPFMPYIDQIARVREELGMKIIMHTGLIRSEAQARALSEAGVDGVALDIIGADETIRKVYHLDATTRDFDRALYWLSKYELSLRPHIIIGLHYGQLLGEWKALEMIARYPRHALVLVIITPLYGTAMWNIDLPTVEEISNFFADARLTIADDYVMLGCARPQGKYKVDVDRAAIDAGLNGIAYPAEGIVQYAIDRGLTPEYYENACSCGVE